MPNETSCPAHAGMRLFRRVRCGPVEEQRSNSEPDSSSEIVFSIIARRVVRLHSAAIVIHSGSLTCVSTPGCIV